MIKNIIFDFGDIFINLDKKKFVIEIQKLGISLQDSNIQEVLHHYEMGLISTSDFVNYFHKKHRILPHDFVSAWNAILLDFPKYRLDFLKTLAKSNSYRLFLLSNTNDLHIDWIQRSLGESFYHDFKDCFEAFYLSQEINLRKPNADIYQFVLRENNLNPEETFFIDDTTENTVAAAMLGIQVWNLIPGNEDVVDLFDKKHL